MQLQETNKGSVYTEFFKMRMEWKGQMLDFRIWDQVVSKGLVAGEEEKAEFQSSLRLGASSGNGYHEWNQEYIRRKINAPAEQVHL